MAICSRGMASSRRALPTIARRSATKPADADCGRAAVATGGSVSARASVLKAAKRRGRRQLRPRLSHDQKCSARWSVGDDAHRSPRSGFAGAQDRPNALQHVSDRAPTDRCTSKPGSQRFQPVVAATLRRSASVHKPRYTPPGSAPIRAYRCRAPRRTVPPRPPRRCRPTIRPAYDRRRCGLMRAAEQRVVGGRAQRRFVHVERAEDRRAGIAQSRDDRRVAVGDHGRGTSPSPPSTAGPAPRCST